MLKKEIPVEKTMFPWFLGVGYGEEVEVGVAMSERESFEVGEEIFRVVAQVDSAEPGMAEYRNMDLVKDEFEQMQTLAQNMERIKQENEEEDTEGRQLAIARTLEWEGYRTDAGEQAWYNTVTGERRYQETKPGTQGDGEDGEEGQQVEQLPTKESLEQRLELIDIEEQLIEGAVVTTEDGTKVTVTGGTDNFGHIYGKAMQAGDYVNMVVDADDIASVVPSPESSIIQGDIEKIAKDNELEVFDSSPNMFQSSINAGFDEPFPDAVTYMDRVAFELDDGAYLIGDVIEKNGHKGSQDPIVRVRTQSGNIRDMNLGDAVGIKSRYEGYDSIADVPTEERLQNPFDFAVERGSLRDYGIIKGGQTGHAMEIITYEDGSRDFLTPLSAMGESDEVRERRAQRNVVQARLGNSMMPGAFAKTERATDPDTGEEFIVKEGVEKRKGGPKRSTYAAPPRSISEPVALGCLLGNADLHKNNVIVTEGATYGESVIIDHDFFADDLSVALASAGWAFPDNYVGQVAVDVYNNRDNIDAEGITDDDREQINQNFKESLYRAAREAKNGNLRNFPAELMRLYEETDGRSEGIAAMPDVIP